MLFAPFAISFLDSRKLNRKERKEYAERAKRMATILWKLAPTLPESNH
jgi:hypothetical protein